MADLSLSKAKQSTNAIERLYVTMRYLLNRGAYSPKGTSGQTLKNLLLLLQPEIYGSIADEEKVELNGLIYVLDRLPKGIESCRYISLTTDEGYTGSHLQPIIAPKRRRNCYRINEEQMNIEITRGRSDIYDILTHLTFLFVEGQKIMVKTYSEQTGKVSREWEFIEKITLEGPSLDEHEYEIGLIHLSSILGRTFEETLQAYQYFQEANDKERLFKIIYWLGKRTLDELTNGKKRMISFSTALRDRIGHHFYGETWARNIKKVLKKNQLPHRRLHIVSANMHSVMNTLYSRKALGKTAADKTDINLYKHLSQDSNSDMHGKIMAYASQHGMTTLRDTSGTNIDVQIIDLEQVDFSSTPFNKIKSPKRDVIIVMDYAFGEQAFEAMDELLKPYQDGKISRQMPVKSISIMGKAGILTGKKGDIMVPDAHIFEGQADNYPFKNALSAKDFKDYTSDVYEGSMVTVLGTSLQNKDLLEYFKESTWSAIGLEMEGAHYQKAIQAAATVRKHISDEVVLRYAYYASDNPLETGSTLASGGLGLSGVEPTYLITEKILEQILSSEE